MPGIIPGITIFGGIYMNNEMTNEKATTITEHVPTDYDYIFDHLIESLVDASWMLMEVSSGDRNVKQLIKDVIEGDTYSVSVQNSKISHWNYRINARQILAVKTKSIEIGIGEYKPVTHEACFIARHKYTARIIFNDNDQLTNVVSNTDTNLGIMEWAPEIHNREITDFLKATYYIIEKRRNDGTLKCCMTEMNKDMSNVII